MSGRRRAVFLGLVALICLAIGETGARLLLRERPRFETLRRRLAGEATAGFQNCVGQPYLLYSPMPGYRSATGAVEHSAMGHRGRVVAMRKEPGVLRVLCLGGSTTYGWTVATAEEAYPAQLEAALAALKPPGIRAVEVINGGLPFGTSAEMLTHWLFKWHYFRPDLVVVNEGGNDAFALDRKWYQPDYAHWRHQPCLPPALPEATRWLMRSRFLGLAYTVAVFGTSVDRFSSVVRADDLPPATLWYPEAGPLDPALRQVDEQDLAFAHNIRSLARAVESDGARLLFVPFRPAPANRYSPVVRRWTEHNERLLAAIAVERGIPLAPFPASAIAPANWTDDCHLNAAGEREKAAHIAEHAARALGWAVP